MKEKMKKSNNYKEKCNITQTFLLRICRMTGMNSTVKGVINFKCAKCTKKL